MADAHAPEAPRPCCPIGALDSVQVIDDALRGGAPYRSVATSHGLSASAVYRHRTRCLGLTAPPKQAPEAGAKQGGEATEAPTEAGEARPTPVPPSPRISAGPNPGDDAVTAPRKLLVATLEAQAVDLRVKGKSYEQIAVVLNVSEDVAMDAVERVLLRTRGKADAKAEQARAIEVRRCDAIIAAFWDRATDPTMAEVQVPGDGPGGLKKYDGQDKAADRLLKAMERRSKLLGLDAPTGPAVQLTLVNAPGFNELVGTILAALVPHPMALADVKVAIRVALGGRRPEPLLIEAGDP